MSTKSLILIAEDDVVSRKVLEALLRDQNYNFASASNGTEALALAHQLVPDAILLDVMMPEIDGYEVCRRIRSSPLLAEVPVLMVTALTEKEARLKGLEAGADDFLAKPYDRAELTARLKTITRLNRYRRILANRIQFSWVLERASEGYLMLDDDDVIHYANPAARKFLAVSVADNEPVKGAFMEFARRQYEFAPTEAWNKWPKASDAGKLPRFLSPLNTARPGMVRLQVEMIDFPTGQAASRLVRLFPCEIPKEVKKPEPVKSVMASAAKKTEAPAEPATPLAEVAAAV